jgi:hypothetical protein
VAIARPIKIRSQYLTSTIIEIKGDNFNYVTGNGLYLSGNRFNTEHVDLYSTEKNLSAANLPFSGIPIEDFNIIDKNNATFSLPGVLQLGLYDVIFCNPAGYKKASLNKKYNYIQVLRDEPIGAPVVTFNGANIVTFSGIPVTTITKYLIEI